MVLNNQLEIIDGIAKQCLVPSAVSAEAQAIREACLVAKVRGFGQALILTDSKSISEVLSSDLDPP